MHSHSKREYSLGGYSEIPHIYAKKKIYFNDFASKLKFFLSFCSPTNTKSCSSNDKISEVDILSPNHICNQSTFITFAYSAPTYTIVKVKES